MPILQRYLTSPIEREYEAWIVREIEDYFRSIGRPAIVWAVSPLDEATWPADVHLLAEGKVIGLQFKKLTLERSSPGQDPDYSRVKWILNDPTPQFGLVQQHSEIFYCFPTFVHRDWSRAALHHCIFWRPDHRVNHNVWYDNPRARTPYNRVAVDGTSYRWGHFVEQIFSCSIGWRVDDPTPPSTYLGRLKSTLQELYSAQGDRRVTDEAAAGDQTEPEDTIFLISIPMELGPATGQMEIEL
jgi:hypothetical protein